MLAYKFSPMIDPKQKYVDTKKFEPQLETRIWPSKRITEAPCWCSVDLRDGNQALRNPMTLEEKLKFWNMLVSLGFKEIEIGFPAASKVEEEFTRTLITENLIPEDVTIQVLSQSRKEQIEKTIDTLRGAKNAIVHLYNSTSELQRRVVFAKNENEIIDIILKGVFELSELRDTTDTNIRLEYSPESFTGTEPDFALKICNAVVAAWAPSKDNKIIINLPATVEMTTPNIYADQIEYFSRNVRHRDAIILSVHPHNDMGMAVSAASLALLAGADRVEGTLFGNGERTGNLDLLVLGLNLYTQGINPNLNFSNVDEIRKVYEECTHMKVHPRHPYAGEVVFTAYSGSHQDAINKGFNAMKNSDSTKWEIPYLPIDPSDIGRKYEPIEINSQSGKGGVAYIVNKKFGFLMPKEMHGEFANVVQQYCEKISRAITSEEVQELFFNTYFATNSSFCFSSLNFTYLDEGVRINFDFCHNTKKYSLEGVGENEVKSFIDAFNKQFHFPYSFEIIGSHKIINSNGEYEIASYAKITNQETGKVGYGIGVGINSKIANVKALFSALKRNTMF